MLKIGILFSQLILLMLLASTARSQHASDQPSIPDPHRHVVPVHQAPWQNDMAPDARFVPIKRSLVGHDTVLSPDGRWRAFVHDRPDERGGRVCLQDVQSPKQYELRGIPLPYRPISNLMWLNDSLLTFDRWSQPHYGIHYVVNVHRLRVVLSTPFPDEFMLRNQGGAKDSAEPHR